MPQEPENKPRSPIEEMNGLRANPPGPIAVPRKASASVDLTRSGGMERQTPTSPPSRLVRSPYQPRDAKVERPSTRDLADFAKSTGPEVRGQLPKPVSRDSNPPRRAKSVAPRFQARDPVVKGPNSDLIDFIREGPPRPLGEGAHRIPRVVAPFRTTMDSDELLALEPPQDHTGRNSGSSYQDGSIVTKSTVNSRTGLIDSKTRTAVTPATTVSQGASSQAPTRNVAEPTQPKRKQRRLRDPYAIDMESDDEIDDGLGKPPKYEEESLIDFLRNTSPPPESQFQPQPLLLSTTYMAAQAPNVLKKPANGGFRERLKRTASTSSLNRITGGRPSQSSSSTTTRSANNQVRPSSPHLVQSGSRLDSYKPTQSTYAAHVDRNRQKTVTQSLDGGKVDGSISKFFTRKRRIAA